MHLESRNDCQFMTRVLANSDNGFTYFRLLKWPYPENHRYGNGDDQDLQR